MFALLTRRKSVQEASPAPAAEAATDTTDDNVLMRFLTQGGATVELHRQTKAVRTMPGSSCTVLPDGEFRIADGFNWRCHGCNGTGGHGRYGMGPGHFDEYQISEARTEANTHATTCRAMPKPTA
jgi:hypothetical protein